jgi:hypothetical protein
MSVGPIADIDQPDAGTDGQQLLQNISGDRLLAFAPRGRLLARTASGNALWHRPAFFGQGRTMND